MFEARRRNKERKILKDLSRESLPKKEAQILFNRVNQEALEREFISQSIPFETQPVIGIKYKGQPLDKKYQPDFICYDEVIVEIKAISSLSGVEQSQIINYLKATNLNVGLLLNFGSKSFEYRRLVYNL